MILFFFKISLVTDELEKLKNAWYTSVEFKWKNAKSNMEENFDDMIADYQESIKTDFSLRGHENDFYKLKSQAINMIDDAKLAYKKIIVNDDKNYEYFVEKFNKLVQILNQVNEIVGDYFHVTIGKLADFMLHVQKKEQYVNRENTLIEPDSVEDDDDFDTNDYCENLIKE